MQRTDTSAAEALGRAHEDLLRDLRKLEDAVRPSSGESMTRLIARLSATRKVLRAHFRFEEQDGYMDAVRKQNPRLEQTIQHLADEHGQLLESLDALMQEAGAAQPLGGLLRDRVRGWVDRVRQHEARENALVQDAVNLDIGAED